MFVDLWVCGFVRADDISMKVRRGRAGHCTWRGVGYGHCTWRAGWSGVGYALSEARCGFRNVRAGDKAERSEVWVTDNESRAKRGVGYAMLVIIIIKTIIIIL